jgi:type IV pilus secretin PilQ/predicted competence protein
MTSRSAFALLLTTLGCVPAARAAAPEAAPAPVVVVAATRPSPASVVATSGEPAVPAPRATAARDVLSVDFPEEEIRNILRNVADLFELNIIVPEALKGRTTIKLRDVTWRQIFDSILQPAGFTYKEEGNIIKIVSNEVLGQEPVTTDVFVLNAAKAADLLPTVASLVDAGTGGKIVVDARSNSLIITERPARLARIKAIVEQLDRTADQVMIETKFIEVSDNDVKNLGVNWSSLANYRVGVGPDKEKGLATVQRTRDQTGSAGFNRNDGTTGSSTSGNNQGTTTSTTNGQNSGSTNANTVTSTNGVPTSTASTGVTSSLTNAATTAATGGVTSAVTQGATNAFNNLASLVNNEGTARTLNAVFSADEFRLVLSALQQQSQVKIVSNPTIVTLNNSEATINVGQERPIPRYQYNQQTGNLEVNGFDFKPIGVILRVTPQVNSRGLIRLTISPEVSQSFNNVSFNGNEIPIIETRKTQTTVSLADGYTMGIGGLLQSTASDAVTKVPVLGSLPVLGRLFRSDARQKESNNLIIFITAKTINAEGATVEQVFDSARLRGLQLRREELPGWRDGSSPFVDGANRPLPAPPAPR